MKSLLECINESLILEDNDLWQSYTYYLKNMPKHVPFKDKDKVTEEDLIKEMEDWFKNNPNLTLHDLESSGGLFGFEQYVLTNWDNVRLLNMRFNDKNNGPSKVTIEYGPKDTPRKRKGTVVDSEYDGKYDIWTTKDAHRVLVDPKDWVHAIVTFLNDNIKE